MPETPEDLHARVTAAAGDDGRLPMPPVHEWDMFPWELVDGELRPKVLPPPYDGPEPARAGAGGVDCHNCQGDGNAVRVWENDRWKLTAPGSPSGLLKLWLVSKEHLDFPDMGDALASEYGRLSTWLCRIMSGMPHVGRVHVCRWGDGSEHLHVWFIARPARIPHLIGSMAVEWDEMLPPIPAEVWDADLAEIGRKLATHDGRALV
jgi:hypothetical protein